MALFKIKYSSVVCSVVEYLENPIKALIVDSSSSINTVEYNTVRRWLMTIVDSKLLRRRITCYMLRDVIHILDENNLLLSNDI